MNSRILEFTVVRLGVGRWSAAAHPPHSPGPAPPASPGSPRHTVLLTNKQNKQFSITGVWRAGTARGRRRRLAVLDMKECCEVKTYFLKYLGNILTIKMRCGPALWLKK